MTDCISREAAIAETRKPRLTDAELRRRLAELPAADVAPVVHGKWVEQHSDFDLCGIVYYECSECKREQQVKWHYCPNCGAKMDGGWDDESAD